ncbi:hypothetical protein PR001_g32532 [Phytophthora rubi]|uniref:Uncharacterized protein n=1 Tax=Phytophthora rubi TaxID=129364 RepID=A0A6A3G8Y0_9STRA|nr:hypothetical protein PR001_g32532 [Phytophthora rubi]KAE8954985.1 hypothetical protein PR002_g31926 [Phytophthora rubi]
MLHQNACILLALGAGIVDGWGAPVRYCARIFSNTGFSNTGFSNTGFSNTGPPN